MERSASEDVMFVVAELAGVVGSWPTLQAEFEGKSVAEVVGMAVDVALLLVKRAEAEVGSVERWLRGGV
jgi:hypothetical protein